MTDTTPSAEGKPRRQTGKPAGRTERPGRRSGQPGARRVGGAAASGQTPPQRAEGELLDVDQAADLLKTSRPTFYRLLRSGQIKGHKVGRQWRFYREDIERFLRGQQPRVELAADIAPLIGALVDRIEGAGGSAATRQDVSEARRAACLMIVLASALRASDLHIEPQIGPDGKTAAFLRYRVDGVMHCAARFDIRLLAAVIEQFKQMAACDVSQKLRPQDGRVLIDLAGGPGGKKSLDLRVCFVPAVNGESLTVRLLDPKAVVLDLDRLQYAPRDQRALGEALAAPFGLIVIAGPMGSGKTTTVYACLNHLTGASAGRTDSPIKVITVEDPVEYQLPGVTQLQVNYREGFTFAPAVRAMLRSDPDVLMVGEIRDRDTLMAVLQASLTGHRVFSQLHTDDAAATLVRMVEIGADPFVAADATRLIIAQRLVRALCGECSAADPSEAFVERAERMARAGGLDWDGLGQRFRRPVGCPKCAKTGYRGRRLIAEMLVVSPAIGTALRRGAGADELRRIAVDEGMTTLAADGVRLADQGVTSLAEVVRVRPPTAD